MNRHIVYKSPLVISKLYNAQVRPLLEYCIQFSYPYQVQDIDRLEQIQRKATKMIPALKHLSAKDRLASLGMFFF